MSDRGSVGNPSKDNAPSPFERTPLFGRWPRRLKYVLPWPLALAAAASLFVRFDTPFEPGDVSTAHAMFSRDCRLCHGEGDAAASSAQKGPLLPVTDEACSVCHAGAAHHELLLQDERQGCAACHREHRGHEVLAAVSDDHCVRCHADLTRTARRIPVFSDQIPSFADHPEFALLDRDPKRIERLLAGDRAIRRVAAVEDGGWHDKATIRLNHKVHLSGDLRRLDGPPRAMACADCHVPGPSGSMLPVSYAKHCASCHADKLVFDSERFPGSPVPHGDAEAARGAIRERYAGVAAKRDNPPAIIPPRIPGRPRPIGPEGWEWTNREVADAERILFEQEKAGCRYCHTAVEIEKGEWTVRPPEIPERWLTHARFRHDAHRMLACAGCHPAAESSSTSSILLPGVDTCRKCHSGTPPAGVSGTARGECSVCHAYHDHRGESFDGPYSLDLRIVAPKNVRQPPERGH